MSNNDLSGSEDVDARNRRAMFVAFALIFSPIVMLSIFLAMRAADQGDPFGWLFGAAILWFFFADHFLGKKAKMLVGRSGFSWLTIPRSKRLVDAFVLVPIFAFCVIDEDATGWAAVQDYAFGFLLMFAIFMFWHEFWAMVKPHILSVWRTFRKS